MMAIRIGLAFVAALGLWLAVGFAAAQRACAHDPRFVCSPRDTGHAVDIADASKSWAYYGGLAPGQSDAFLFTLSRQTAVPWSLLVDARDAENAARPGAAMFDGSGKLVARIELSGRSTFYEPFSRESYLQSPVEHLILRPGKYSIIVTMAGAQRQRYVMAIGEAERFSPLEVPYVVGAIARIRDRRY